jgi:uncharacterized radical SAM superfamily Fe-S cluster-containing enzyme
MQVRDYVYRGTTRSLCPECKRVVEAKIIVRGQRVYFRKHCPVHGTREDFVCSDVAYFDQHEFDQPARTPKSYGTEADKGCPHDCGLCPEHEQHTCIGLIEITSSCNLRCPMCFAESGPGGKHIDFETYKRMVDRYVQLEGIADVLQLSGGEPTLHPDLVRMVEYAYAQPIQVVMINTNGIRFARDPELVDRLATMRDRLEIYLQFDGVSQESSLALRGEDLLATKMAALDRLRDSDIRCTLVCTVEHTANSGEVGEVLKFGLTRSEVRGVSYQIATYCGRHLPASDLERRTTMPDLVKSLVAQVPELLREDDFYPLPCAHPNCHRLAYLYRGGEQVVPVSRLIDPRPHMDLIANSIVYTPTRARNIVAKALASSGDCGCGPNGCGPVSSDFIEQALAEQLTGKDVFRVTLTGFLDSYTFDTRRVMKCCLAHILPSGHIIPFCAYNTLYRDGTLPLPPLAEMIERSPIPRKELSLPLIAAGDLR